MFRDNLIKVEEEKNVTLFAILATFFIDSPV